MIHHFYHIYADGQWQQPVEEHIRALKESGLVHRCTMYVGIVGSDDNRQAVKDYFIAVGKKGGIIAEATTGRGQVTQIPKWEIAQHKDGFILNAHSKGASNPSDVNIRWRRSMIWHNVIQWRLAVEKLKDHGTYGCHWIQPLVSGMPEHRQGNWMYAGTFFWCRAVIMRTWMRPPLNHRHEAEGWIGYKYAEEPWPVWDCTPYFPNTNTFMDGWINDPDYSPEEKGISIPPRQTINSL